MNRVINLIGLINYIVKLKITYTEGIRGINKWIRNMNDGIRGINYVDKVMNAEIRK
jgi:hypothetical protein